MENENGNIGRYIKDMIKETWKPTLALAVTFFFIIMTVMIMVDQADITPKLVGGVVFLSIAGGLCVSCYYNAYYGSGEEQKN